MDEKIEKRPFPKCYPVWGWFQFINSKKQKPDLRYPTFLSKGEKGVLVEIFKEDNKVLLSDFSLWHFTLSYSYIADNEAEDDKFDLFFSKNNLQYHEKDKYTPEMKQRIELSWNKIFDMNYVAEYATDPYEKKQIQATFWTLSTDEIIKVEEFIAH